MCGIIDVNVLGEALGGDPSEAGPRFIVWVSIGRERLVVSKALLREIGSYGAKVWLQQGIAANRVKEVADGLVDARRKSCAVGRSVGRMMSILWRLGR